MPSALQLIALAAIVIAGQAQTAGLSSVYAVFYDFLKANLFSLNVKPAVGCGIGQKFVSTI